MPRQQTSLTDHQTDLVNIIRVAHANLAVARRTRSAELDRRLTELKVRLARQLDEDSENIRLALDRELVAHEAALDEALIVAYNEGVPIRRVALDGFGNRYDGTATALFAKLRSDGRLGSREGFQRDSSGERTTVSFPKAVDVDALLNAASSIAAPSFTNNGPFTVVEPDRNGNNGIVVPSVLIHMDSRDPYFTLIAPRMRPDSPHKGATTATLYLNFQGDLITHESREASEQYWDHPVARWVKEHPEAARAGFDAALAQ